MVCGSCGVALRWRGRDLRSAPEYPATRPNYLGGTGLVYPMRSSTYRAMLGRAGATAGAGVAMQVDLAIVQGLFVEAHAMVNGDCR
jgi:hypothetical protein